MKLHFVPESKPVSHVIWFKLAIDTKVTAGSHWKSSSAQLHLERKRSGKLNTSMSLLEFVTNLICNVVHFLLQKGLQLQDVFVKSQWEALNTFCMSLQHEKGNWPNQKFKDRKNGGE